MSRSTRWSHLGPPALAGKSSRRCVKPCGQNRLALQSGDRFRPCQLLKNSAMSWGFQHRPGAGSAAGSGTSLTIPRSHTRLSISGSGCAGQGQSKCSAGRRTRRPRGGRLSRAVDVEPSSSGAKGQSPPQPCVHGAEQAPWVIQPAQRNGWNGAHGSTSTEGAPRSPLATVTAILTSPACLHGTPTTNRYE